MSTQAGLRVKSYFAPSVDAAIAQARQELGDEALLLNTRKLSKDAGQAGGYEVVFGLAGQPAPAPAPAVAPLSLPEFRALPTGSRQESGRGGKSAHQESHQ